MSVRELTDQKRLKLYPESLMKYQRNLSEMNCGLKCTAINAPIGLTWRAVNACEKKGPQTQT